jgi:hypothetical protein
MPMVQQRVQPGMQASLRFCMALGAVTLGTCALGSTAVAAPNCSNFFSNSDGSWTPTHQILMAGPTSQMLVGPGDRFRAGTPGVGGRIGRYLDAHCRFSRASVGPRGIPANP